ncbi:MAG: trypsin-like peptidase domain-containing protein [Planctomycetes bacterium]|nr:trypsin-like peptidase domain-containing protein [Planctomycetota bacterium]
MIPNPWWVPAALLVCAGLPAQHPALSDPLELLRLQPVLRSAMRAVAPSTVRVETFGGTRQILTEEGQPADAVSGPQRDAPLRYTPKHLEELFGKIDPDELGQLWRDAGLEPKPAGEPFEARDLQRLGDARLKQLFRKYRCGPFAPRPERGGLGALTPPGFLQAQGATTGVVLEPDGWILVSRFALNFDPTTILVTLPDGRSFTARRAGEDTSRGIALVKIDATDLPVPTFLDPTEVRVGEWAFALGRTFGGGPLPSVHVGIVSATDRLFGRAVQIDANTSPANYGGPVIDVRGRVLGIAVPLSPQGRDAGVDWYDSGIGFAATVANLGELVDRMKAGEILHRGWLGIGLAADDLGPGARVANVAPESPARGVGLRPGDEIVTIDGTEVRNPFHLQVLLGAHMAGDPVHLRHRRGDGEPVGITVFLAEVPRAEREESTRAGETFQPPWEGDRPPEGGR